MQSGHISLVEQGKTTLAANGEIEALNGGLHYFDAIYSGIAFCWCEVWGLSGNNQVLMSYYYVA